MGSWRDGASLRGPSDLKRSSSGDVELIWATTWPRGQRPGQAGECWKVLGAVLLVTAGEGFQGWGGGVPEQDLGRALPTPAAWPVGLP